LRDADAGFVLTTYGTLRRDAPRLAAHRWGLVVADEAQHVKNPASGTAKALRTIPAPARVALTGTPVENNLSELWAILDWTTPGLLGTLPAFRARWAGPIEADRDDAVAERFAQLVRAVPAPPPQGRPRHRTRAARQDRDRPAGRAHPRADGAVRGDRARTARRGPRQ
jgi:SNF2 family DNA or RNA helicase